MVVGRHDVKGLRHDRDGIGIVQGRSVAECAEVLTMTEGRVLLTQHRALSVLRARLGTP